MIIHKRCMGFQNTGGFELKPIQTDKLASTIMNIIVSVSGNTTKERCIKQHLDLNLGTYSTNVFAGDLRKIWDYIYEYPGTTMTQISIGTNVNPAQVCYYARALEDLGSVRFEHKGSRKRAYAKVQL